MPAIRNSSRYINLLQRNMRNLSEGGLSPKCLQLITREMTNSNTEEEMKRLAFLWLVAAFALLLLCAQIQLKIHAQQPPAKIYAQQLVDEAIKKHSNLLVL